jgi:transcriptional regulator with XRE-family HTH domain
VCFNVVLRKLRKKTIYTQEEIAEKLGLLRSTYAKYETGENEPDFKTLVKIAEYYEISTDELLGRKVKCNDNMYRACKEIKSIVKELGVNDDGIFDIERWKILDKEDVEDIIKHFDWIVYNAIDKNN